MNQLIACCGLSCEDCEARIATIKNDDNMRREVSVKWCQLNHTDQITPESINCMGCRTEGVKFAFCQSMCQIRKCVGTKGFETCGQCPDIMSCDLIKPLLEQYPVVKRNLEVE